MYFYILLSVYSLSTMQSSLLINKYVSRIYSVTEGINCQSPSNQTTIKMKKGGYGRHWFKQSVLDGKNGGSFLPPAAAPAPAQAAAAERPSAVLCCHLGRAAGPAGGSVPRPRSSRCAPAAAVLPGKGQV